jgi:hypothetical protein
MKSYSDLTAIDTKLKCILQLEPVGTPEVEIIIGKTYAGGKLFRPITVEVDLDLSQPFAVQIELKNKIYDLQNETAVVIKMLQIDNIDIIPRFDYLAVYSNDHNNTDPTSYLGFNGKWTLTFDQPFYQWLHQATGQGWLLS